MTPPKPGDIYEGYAHHVEMVDGVWTGGWRPEVEIVEVAELELPVIKYKYLNCGDPTNMCYDDEPCFHRRFTPTRPQNPIPERLNFKPSKNPAPEA